MEQLVKGGGSVSSIAEFNVFTQKGVKAGVPAFDAASATYTLPCFTIRTGSDYCLESANAGYASGNEVRAYSCDGTDEQEWEFTGEGLIRHIDSGLTLDSYSDVSIWSEDGTSGQYWNLDDGYLSNGGAYLELGSQSDASDVYMASYRGADDYYYADQQFFLAHC